MAIDKKSLKVVIIILAFIGGYFGWCYIKTESNTKEKSDHNVIAEFMPGHVREIGYIFDMTVSTDLIKHQKEVTWWVKIPATNILYTCNWESGFHEYKKGEGVELIHFLDDADRVTWDGFITGLHGKHKGKLAYVWAVNNESNIFE